MEASNRTALVVDDDADVRSMVAALLEQDGWQTIEAGTGEEGLQLAAASLPDLMIMDVMLPGMSGFEAYKALRGDYRTSHIPVIILTAVNEHELGANHDADSVGRMLCTDGPQAFIDKPVDSEQLRSAIEHALNA